MFIMKLWRRTLQCQRDTLGLGLKMASHIVLPKSAVQLFMRIFWGWGGEWGELSMKCFHFRGGEGLTILDKSALTKELQCHQAPLAWGNHPWQICSNGYPREVIFGGGGRFYLNLGTSCQWEDFISMEGSGVSTVPVNSINVHLRISVLH